jgi:hypothetical protein
MCPTIHNTEADMSGHLPIIILRKGFLSGEIFDPLQISHSKVWRLCLLLPPHILHPAGADIKSAWSYTSTQLHGVTTRNVIVYHY